MLPRDDMMGGPGGSGAMGGGMPAQGAPSPAPGASAGDPGMIREQLVMLLEKAKQMADQAGVDWNEVLSAVEGKKVKSNQPMPRPPMPPKP